MGWAFAFWRSRTALVILAALLLGISACGNTIPDTGTLDGTPQDGQRLAPLAERADSSLTPAGNLFCPILRYPSLNDLSIYPIADLAEPPPREPFYDPVFGSCLARLTDRTIDPSATDGSGGMHAPGAGVQAFNTDSTRILIQSTHGDWYVYDAETLLPVLRLPMERTTEVFWDPSDPFLLYYLRGTRLLRYSLVNGQETLVHNFTPDFSGLELDRVSTLGGSSMTEDGQIWGLAGLDASGSALVLMIYSLAEDRVTSHMHLQEPRSISGVRISPRGHFLLVRYHNSCAEPQGNSTMPFCGLVAYDSTLSSGQIIAPAAGSFDTAYNIKAHEVVVYHDQASSSISLFDLKKTERQALLLIDAGPAAMNLEISGRALDKPGWALISVYSVPAAGSSSWLDSAIVAFELKPDGIIARLAQNHSVYTAPGEGLWVHPSASPNRTFTRVVFSSNWGSSNGHVEAYMIALPTDWASPVQENPRP